MNNNLYYTCEAENDMGLALVLKGPWSDNYIDIIKKENISVLRLSDSAGWREKDISFLEKLQDAGLRGVEVYSWDVKDITPLQYIPNLEHLGLQCEFSKAPDFSKFNKLKICKLTWQPKAKTVFDCSGLKLLNISNYPDEDLKNLKNLTGLKRLQLFSRKLTSLAGIESLKDLRILELALSPKLESLVGIGECQEIDKVEMTCCKKVHDISALGELTNLREVLLTDCGKIKSLKPLAQCQSLETLCFVGDTNIEDGDLRPLLDVPKLKKTFFRDRRHYSHKNDIIKLKLENKLRRVVIWR